MHVCNAQLSEQDIFRSVGINGMPVDTASLRLLGVDGLNSRGLFSQCGYADSLERGECRRVACPLQTAWRDSK